MGGNTISQDYRHIVFVRDDDGSEHVCCALGKLVWANLIRFKIREDKTMSMRGQLISEEYQNMVWVGDD
ncbi:MAG: hypothetical protein HKP52_05510 [Desulfofustis sp.]|nr:hypothetical protein [Desulfofustis sp.]